MNFAPLIRLAYELAAEILHEELKKRRERKRWPKTGTAVRGCPRCREIAYTPGQTLCNKCGAPLERP